MSEEDVKNRRRRPARPREPDTALDELEVLFARSTFDAGLPDASRKLAAKMAVLTRHLAIVRAAVQDLYELRKADADKVDLLDQGLAETVERLAKSAAANDSPSIANEVAAEVIADDSSGDPARPPGAGKRTRVDARPKT